MQLLPFGLDGIIYNDGVFRIRQCLATLIVATLLGCLALVPFAGQ
jgi:hypothetical protein